MPNAGDMKPIAVEGTSNYVTELDYDGSGNLIYVGIANIGISTSAAAWRIKKLVYTGSNLTSVLFAQGSDAFVNAWSSRTSYSYS